MKHAIIPFPAGLQQGELVLHLQLEDGDDPDDVVEKLLIAHSRRPIGEVLVAPGELSGARGRALALALTQRWEIAIIGSLRDTAWPSTPLGRGSLSSVAKIDGALTRMCSASTLPLASIAALKRTRLAGRYRSC